LTPVIMMAEWMDEAFQAAAGYDGSGDRGGGGAHRQRSGAYDQGADGSAEIDQGSPPGAGDRPGGHQVGWEGRVKGDPGGPRSLVAADRADDNGRRDPGHDVRRSGAVAWDSRFKKASAERRRAREGLGNDGVGAAGKSADAPVHERRPTARKIGDEVIAKVREISPLKYLQRHYAGVTTNNAGTSIVVDGVLRVDFRKGRWLACGWGQEPIGDNIKLVQHVEPGTSFPDAVFKLGGRSGPGDAPLTVAEPKPRVEQYPTVPYQAGQEIGRAYLTRARGISPDVVKAAEAAKMVRYCKGAVLFVGWDEVQTRIRSATLRHFEPTLGRDGETMVTKRDLAHTDKGYPAVLPGSSRIVLVEGGVNALACWAMADRRGEERPTVITTGGVGVRRFLETPHVRKQIEQADRVEIWGEREIGADGQPDLAKQAKTNAMRDLLAHAVAELRHGEMPESVIPPERIPDAAAWNVRQVEELERAERQRLKASWQDSHDIGYGPESLSPYKP
jgi:hypothetical protein